MTKAKVSELLEKVPLKRNEKLLLIASEALNLNDAEKEALKGLLGLKKKSGGKLSPAAMNRLNHRLLEVMNKLILLDPSRGFNFWENYQLLEIYREHGAEKNFMSALKRAYQILDGPGAYDHAHYLHLFLLKESEFSQRRGVRKKQEEFGDLESYLDAYYYENKIRLLCEKQNRANVLNIYREETAFEKSIQSGFFETKSLGAQMYLCIYNMLRNRDDKEFYFLTSDFFKKHAERFTEMTRLAVRIFLINHCGYYFNKGDLTFTQEYLDHIECLLENKSLFVKEILTPGIFKSITTAGLAMGRTDWTENFVKSYAKYLPADHRNDILNYNLAEIYFSKGDLDKAQTLLRDISLIDVFYRIGAGKLLLKIYFERGNYELVQATLPSFKKFIQRNRYITGQNRTKLFNFIECLKRMMKGEKIDVSGLEHGLTVFDLLWFNKIAGNGEGHSPA